MLMYGLGHMHNLFIFLVHFQEEVEDKLTLQESQSQGINNIEKKC